MDAKTIISVIMKLPGLVPAVGEKINQLQGSPNKEERDLLIKYVRRLDERRVFFHPFDSEVVESCVGSLDQVKEFTYEALANIEHPAAKAACGAILDATRRFLDKWRAFGTPHARWGFDAPMLDPHRRGEAKTLQDFFADLGELRASVKLMVGLLRELEPKIAVTNLTDAESASP